MKRAPRLANGELLAAALGIGLRQLQNHRRRGLPMPGAGETVEAWASGAKQWIAEHRGRSGPKVEAGTDREKLAHWDWRWRKARAEREELDLKVARGDVHSKTTCEREDVERYEELRAFFSQLPDRLARRLYQAPSPEAIKIMVEEEVRDAFERFRRARRGDDEAEAASEVV